MSKKKGMFSWLGFGQEKEESASIEVETEQLEMMLLSSLIQFQRTCRMMK